MTIPDLDHLGQALAYLRTRRELTATEVSERSGITKAMLSGYERNSNKPSMESLAKILWAMEASFGDLDEALARVGVEDGVSRDRVSLRSALLGREASRRAAVEVLVAVQRFCAVVLGELGQDSDEKTGE